MLRAFSVALILHNSQQEEGDARPLGEQLRLPKPCRPAPAALIACLKSLTKALPFRRTWLRAQWRSNHESAAGYR